MYNPWKFSATVVIITIITGLLVCLLTQWPTWGVGWLNLLVGWPLIVLLATLMINPLIRARLRGQLDNFLLVTAILILPLFMIVGLIVRGAYLLLVPSLLAVMLAISIHIHAGLSNDDRRRQDLNLIISLIVCCEAWYSIVPAIKLGSLMIIGTNVVWAIITAFLTCIIDLLHSRQ